MNAIERNRFSDTWRQLGARLPRPSAILAVSAHWYTRSTLVAATEKPRTLHDFHGFPPALYQCEYPAPGAPQLARRIAALLEPLPVGLDGEWGLDHGVWSILMHMYPQAGIPTLQLSIDATRPAEYHYRLGQRLRPLRNQGVLILASGNVVHNLALMHRGDDAGPFAWASSFNDRVRDALIRRDHAFLLDYLQSGEAARLSVPSEEHFLPLLYALGASGPNDRIEFPVDGIERGAISMLSVLYS